MASISIYIARHLCTAPRPHKEAEALAAAGHEVTIHGIAFNSRMSRRDQAISDGRPWHWKPVINFADTGLQLRWGLARFRHRFSRKIFRYTGKVFADVWSYGNARLREHAFRHSVDLTIVHAEGGLWFGRELIRHGRKVGVDFEDWFSEDLTPSQRRERPVAVLRELESFFCRNAPYCLTTSRSLATAMSSRYGSNPPTVVYNSFPCKPSLPHPREVSGPVRFHWFSLKIGPERGLEALMEAFNQIPENWELHLRGDVDSSYRKQLISLLHPRLHSRIFFRDLVPADQLAAALVEFDVGLALESSKIPSRNLTITNKLFHYLQSGLPVIGSDTAGSREILSQQPSIGQLVPPDDIPVLAETLACWAASPMRINSSKSAARRFYNDTLAHENQCDRYAEMAERALDL